MATHFQLAHAFYSYTCLNAEPASCDSQICSCPCHFIVPDEMLDLLFQSMTGVAIMHLLFAYPRSRFYDTTFATAVTQSRRHPQETA